MLVVEIRDDGVGGADAAAGLRPGRPARPRARARRHARRREPARRAGPRSRRCCRAGSHRRGLGAAARGPRPAARRGRHRGRRRGRRRRGAAPRGRARTGPTSASSTSACRRRSPTRACAPRWRSAREHPEVGGAGALAVRRGALRRASCSPAAASGVGYLLKDRVADVRRVRRRAAARRRRRHRARPGGRRAAARRAGARIRSSRSRPREREVLGADGRGAHERGDRRAARGHRAARSRSTSPASSRKLGCRRADEDHRRVLAVLAWLNGS